LLTNSDLPKKVGRIPIVWTLDFSTFRPIVSENIIMPLRALKSCQMLLDGEQCLATYAYRRDAHILFGKDEGPFATGVTRKAYRAFEAGGEEAFYDSLVPPIIEQLSLILGRKYDRQGDIYILPIAKTWEETYTLLDSLFKIKIFSKEIPKLRFPLYGTRHHLSGFITSAAKLHPDYQNLKRIKRSKRGRCGPLMMQFFLIAGEIIAPDHEPYATGNNVCLVQRSINLTDLSTD